MPYKNPPQQSPLIYAALFILMLVISPLQSTDAAPGSMSKQQAWKLLQSGDSESVRALPRGEREILLATLALKAGRTAEAIAILSSKALEKNPLAALIRAEGYRRQSVQAARRAGNYAHAVKADIKKLHKARLSIGLNDAEKRLQAFMTGYKHSAPKQVAKPVIKPTIVASRKAIKTTGTRLPDTLLLAIEAWRKDWESRNGDAYLSHYHPAFRTAKYDYNSWSAYKRRVNNRKKYINVNVSNLRLVRGPEQITEGTAILVSFKQRYQSSNYAANSKKQLYMVRGSNNRWLILHEGDANSSFSRITSKPRPIISNASALKTAKPGSWAINLGSFDSKSNAKQMASNINLTGTQQPFVSKTFVGNKQVHRVRIGLYSSRKNAVDAMVKICPDLNLTDCWLEQVK